MRSEARIRQAFVLGAGLGLRLRPLTEGLPKPLVPVFQKLLITFSFDHLIRDLGIERFYVNTHHQPHCFTAAFPDGRYRDRPVSFRHEPVLLDTGGGIKNIEGHLGDEPFITYSGDILADFQLRPLMEEHFRAGNDVTLGLRHTGLAAPITCANGRITNIGRYRAHPGEYDFANVAIWNPAILSRLPANEKISFIPVVADWIEQGGRIGGVPMDDGQWFNIGSPAEYLQVHRLIASGSWQPAYVADPDWQNPVHRTAKVDPSARLRGCSVVGPGAVVGRDAVLEDTIVWEGAEIASQSALSGCIVRAQKTAAGSLRDQVI